MRRGKRVLLTFLAAVALAALAGVIVVREVFVIRNVLISAETSLSDTEIIRAASIEMGASIFDVDEAHLRNSLERTGTLALDSVSVEYPNTVILQVRERTRDATVLNGGKILVLDSDGYVIEVCDAMPESCGVYVTDLEAAGYRVGGKISAPSEKLEALKIITEEVRRQNAASLISEVNLKDLQNIWMLTRTGIHVEIGTPERMDQKILWIRTAVPDLEQRQETGTLDVSSGSRADYRQ